MNTLRNLRETADLTLRQVEEATGISNAYLSQLESGKIKNPSAQVIYTLAKFYNCDLEKLLIEASIVKHKDVVPAQMRLTIEKRFQDLEQRILRLESANEEYNALHKPFN